MMSVRLYGEAVLGTIRRDAAIFFSYRLRLIGQILGMLFSFSIFYYISKLVRADAVGPQGRYFAFVVLGIVTTSVLTSALTTAQVIRMELMAGNFERVLISPLGPVWGVICVAAFPIVYSTVFASFMLVLAAIVFGVQFDASGIAPAIGVSLLASVSLACIGLFFVAALLAFKSALGATWIIAGLSLLGGAYFPLKLFPGWIRWASDVQPFTPSVDLLRHLLIGTRPIESVWLELAKLVGFTAVLLPASFAALSLAVHVSRRRGTIMEY